MSKKTYLILIVGVFVVVAVIAGVFIYNAKKSNLPAQTTGTIGTQAGQGQVQQSLTKTNVPANITVPDVGAKPVSADVAVPTSVAAAAPGVSAKLRTFNIQASNDLYNPSTVIVKVGDTVHINFTAVDKTYDITFPDYGMKQTATKGQTKILEFQAVSQGKFTYYCDLCGGLTSKTIGYIIVAP